MPLFFFILGNGICFREYLQNQYGMSKISIWRDTVEPALFPSLTNDISVDVAIIGGGITGITAAYNLGKAGKRVVVLEAFQVGSGDTGSSTGNL